MIRLNYLKFVIIYVIIIYELYGNYMKLYENCTKLV